MTHDGAVVQQLAPEIERRLLNANLSYAHVGATEHELPDGYRHIRAAVHVGSGLATFERCSAALFAWQVHERAGLAVAAGGPVEVGVVATLRTTVFGWPVTAACRVVCVADLADRCGFAYGTLPGHPESGEEAFMIQIDSEGAVTCAITAFSKPASALARVSGPIARRAQDQMNQRYRDAFVATATS